MKTIALANGEMINFTKLANDCQVPPSTVTEYVGLLEDTLIGFLLPAWTDFKGLKYLKEEGVFNNFILVSQDPISTFTDGILTLPWQNFLSDLWEDKLI